MYKSAEYDTSSLMTGLYERFDSNAYDDDITTFTALERYVKRTLRRWHRDYAIKRTMACLSKLDDRQLADIGLSYDEIPAAARRSVADPNTRDPRAFGKM
jgi:uncharacterized protein YjiS (DUF1127 family)